MSVWRRIGDSNKSTLRAWKVFSERVRGRISNARVEGCEIVLRGRDGELEANRRSMSIKSNKACGLLEIVTHLQSMKY